MTTTTTHNHQPAPQSREQVHAMIEAATCEECGIRIFQREFSIGGSYLLGAWVPVI